MTSGTTPLKPCPRWCRPLEPFHQATTAYTICMDLTDLDLDTAPEADVLLPDNYASKNDHVAALCERVILLRRMLEQERAARSP